jgi:hypothetical protein
MPILCFTGAMLVIVLLDVYSRFRLLSAQKASLAKKHEDLLYLLQETSRWYPRPIALRPSTVEGREALAELVQLGLVEEGMYDFEAWGGPGTVVGTFPHHGLKFIPPRVQGPIQ